MSVHRHQQFHANAPLHLVPIIIHSAHIYIILYTNKSLILSGVLFQHCYISSDNQDTESENISGQLKSTCQFQQHWPQPLNIFLVPTKCILNTSLSTCDLLLVHSAEVYNCYCVYVVQRSVVPYTFLYNFFYAQRDQDWNAYSGQR